MSVFASKPIALDLTAMRTGIGWAQSWTKRPILCTISDGWMRLMVVENRRFLASWAWPMPDFEGKVFFLIPRFVAKTIASPATWEADSMEVVLNSRVVGLILREGQQEFRLQWRWNPHDFDAPPEFGMMSRIPDTIVRTPYIALADVIHLAIHNLVNTTVAENLLQNENAILIDFTPGQINIDGESIAHGRQSRYYFNPRMIIRGLEIVRERQVGFAMKRIGRGDESILYLSSQRDRWQVHCALHSVAVSSPEQSSNPPMRVRETRPPLANGSWLSHNR